MPDHTDPSIHADLQSLALLAGEACTLLGKPAQITITWPEGTPMGMTEQQLQGWAADTLAELRLIRDRPAAPHTSHAGYREEWKP
ncbi:hypothetical protein [Micromonospora haikouensis]|uniref:hypothetical protein n=1 Tax=Micromonospora haikouensis TaxID=686309 RepID=UPI003D710E33